MRTRYSNLAALVLCFAFSLTVIAQGSNPIIPSLSVNSGSTSAQPSGRGLAPDSRGWTDPALNHNRLLRDRLGEGSLVVIGAYKVMGSPFLFGPRKNADLFSVKEKAYNIDINYNTYNQEVEFYSTSNPSQPLVKEAGELDSFVMKKNIEAGMTEDIVFIYGSHVGSSEKVYFQLVERGEKFSLYKRYTSDLGFPSSNYSQAELRQFDLHVDYFYYDAATKKMKKLKSNLSTIIKEFKDKKDVTPVADKDAFAVNPEAVMKKIFLYLNQ